MTTKKQGCHPSAAASAAVISLFIVTRLVVAGAYMTSPRSRNYFAYEEGVSGGGIAGLPNREYCPHCLNSNDNVCGKSPGGNNYDDYRDSNGDPMPWISQDNFDQGEVILVKSYLDIHQNGHMELRACPLGQASTPECFDQPEHSCTFVEDVLYGMPSDPNYPERGYYAGGQNGGIQSFEMLFKLPDGILGNEVMLQWKYITANGCIPPGYPSYFAGENSAGVSLPDDYWTSDLGLCIPPYPNNGDTSDEWPEQFFNCVEVSIAAATYEPSVSPGACDFLDNFQVPRSSSYPSVSNYEQYDHVHVSEGGPTILNQVTKHVTQWSAPNLFEFSLNLNVNPFYIDLMACMTTYSFAQTNPDFTLSGCALSGLDGDYWINTSGNNEIWVRKDNSYAIAFTKDGVAPEFCGTASPVSTPPTPLVTDAPVLENAPSPVTEAPVASPSPQHVTPAPSVTCCTDISLAYQTCMDAPCNDNQDTCATSCMGKWLTVPVVPTECCTWGGEVNCDGVDHASDNCHYLQSDCEGQCGGTWHFDGTTVNPSYSPSQPSQPSSLPSSMPSDDPSSQPSFVPSHSPSGPPSDSLRPTTRFQPSSSPSQTSQPSSLPSSMPSDDPSSQPSFVPSHGPSGPPSNSLRPTVRFQPSSSPSEPSQPSSLPSSKPSDGPSVLLSFVPSHSPSGVPSHSLRPTMRPTTHFQPSSSPSQPSQPSSLPSSIPSDGPSSQPIFVPSQSPSGPPTKSLRPTTQLQPFPEPTSGRSSMPSHVPSSSPLASPFVVQFEVIANSLVSLQDILDVQSDTKKMEEIAVHIRARVTGTNSILLDWNCDGYEQGEFFASDQQVAVIAGNDVNNIFVLPPKVAGVYSLCVYPYESDGEDTFRCQSYFVVYDPEGGSVAGQGWVETPLDAFRLPRENFDSMAKHKRLGKSSKGSAKFDKLSSLPSNGNETELASFGFTAKYEKGAPFPNATKGDKKFDFHVEGFTFESTIYHWVAVTGTSRAKVQGDGTINGIDGYSFLLTAVSGSDFDYFRVKIFNSSMDNNKVVYDTFIGQDAEECWDDCYRGLLLSKGIIKIRPSKKKGGKKC